MLALAVSFTNFGPYHLARLRALAGHLARSGGRLIAYETAGAERCYPWQVARRSEPFDWVTLFPEQALEDLPRAACKRAMRRALERDRPDAVFIAGYHRPEGMALLAWANQHGRPAILMSETQRLDYRRVWWKEAIKRRRVRRFSAALVGGPRHRSYLIDLGMPADRIALGYDVVDNAHFAARAEAARRSAEGRRGLPERPYFLAVSRFVPEKNLARLVRAFAAYRRAVAADRAWDLVLCGGGPGAPEVEDAVRDTGLGPVIHRPGFLQTDELSRWYAFASAFVHPSLLEPWGLVVNEAAACGLPLLVTQRAGCVETLVPDPPGTTGRRFDPFDEEELADALRWMADLPDNQRAAMGRRAAEIVAAWGPERFASGAWEAFELANRSGPSTMSDGPRGARLTR
ncbi:MAG: glycosyltransferase family 4 protein [Isosphaeraceae bacterium]|nr:glycosyltransferase family 4 protein [Isosphaeraceae bacterium]